MRSSVSSGGPAWSLRRRREPVVGPRRAGRESGLGARREGTGEGLGARRGCEGPWCGERSGCRARGAEAVPVAEGAQCPCVSRSCCARTGCPGPAGRCHTLPALSAGALRCSALGRRSPCPDRCPAPPGSAPPAAASCCSSLSPCRPRSLAVPPLFLSPCSWAAGCAQPARPHGTWQSSATVWTMPSEAPRAARSARRRS